MSGKWWEELPKASALDVALEAEGIGGALADVARSIYAQESGSGKNTTTSNAGAVGGMQILPGTFQQVADKGWDIADPIHNARAGVRYLRAMYERADGDPALAAVGYYGGPGGQDKAKKGEAVADPRNPKAPTTLEYAQQVVNRLPGADKSQQTGMRATEKASKATEGGDWWQQYPEVQQASQAPSKAEPQTEPQTAPKPSMGRELLRQVGLTARAGVNGLASIPAMMSDAVTGPINAGLDKVRGEGNGFRFKKAGASMNDLMTRAGVPEPQNSTERVVGDVAAAMAGAGGFVGAGKAIAQAGGAVAKGVGSALSAGPGLQVTSAATGAGATGAVRENGGGTGAQVAAGIAGALAPSVLPALGGAAVRGALRGGEAGRQAVADTIETFRGAGTSPTLGQATGGRFARATESLLSKTPGGAGVMGEYANKQADSMAKAVQQLSDDLAPGASAANAGEAIARGINAFKSGFKTVQQRLYRNLDRHIPADTTIAVDNTRGALAALNADIDGAVNLSAMFKNAKIGGIERALLADLDEAAKAAAGAGDDVAGQVAGLPYEAIKKLRTLVGSELADATFVSDVPRSKWSALYGALSDDLGVAAKNAGPDAEAAWQWANQFTKTQMARLEDLSGIVTKDSPEKIFNAAIAGTAEGDTIARRVISALPMRERREVSGALLQRLGRATPGQQNATGDAFSSETFLTNLSKMSPAARGTLFGRTDVNGVIEKLQQFAVVADSRREGGRIFANPSGTAPAAAQIGLGSGIAGGVVAAAAGQPLPLMGALAVPALANAGAKMVTSPKVLELAASQASLSPGAGAAMVNAAANVDWGGSADQTVPMAAPEPQTEQWWLDAPMVEAAPVGAGMVAGPMDATGAATAVDMPMPLPEPMPMAAPIPEPMPLPMAAPMPLQSPIMEPLEVLPPVDTRSQMQRLSGATSVDEAIAALHEPSPVEVARVEVSRLEVERQKLEAMRQRARAMRMDAERELQQAAALRKQAEWERIESMRMGRSGAVVR